MSVLALSLTVTAQASVRAADTAGITELPPDSSQVRVRMPSPESLETLMAENDFSYLQRPSAVGSWWERFWIWLGQQFSRAFAEGDGFSFWSMQLTRILPWAVALLALILVSLKLLGINPDALLRKKPVTADHLAALKVAGEGPDNFEELLENALRRRDFRLAIRLYYLDILRRFARAGLIEWHPDKTNRQYFHELGDKHLRERFGRLTRVFEYVWYGEADPGEKEFNTTQAEFQALKNTIGALKK